MRVLLLLTALSACRPANDGDSAAVSTSIQAPTLEIVTPAEGDVVDGPQVAVSVVLTNASLPAAHTQNGNGAFAIAYMVDGLIVAFESVDTYAVPVEEGSRRLGAELWWADGDPVLPTAADEITVTVR